MVANAAAAPAPALTSVSAATKIKRRPHPANAADLSSDPHRPGNCLRSEQSSHSRPARSLPIANLSGADTMLADPGCYQNVKVASIVSRRVRMDGSLEDLLKAPI